MAYINRHQVLGTGNMEQLNYNFASKTAAMGQVGKSTGVVNSGNLEVLVLQNTDTNQAKFSIATTVNGFAEIWQAVVSDFATKFAVGGLEFVLHDSGATPSVVSLRLRQAYENYLAVKSTLAHAVLSYTELSPRARINALVDAGSFSEIYPPQEQLTSPHLGDLDLLTAFDDGVVIGDAKLNGQAIAVIAQQANFMGGAVGEVNGAKIAGICQRALKKSYAGVLILIDSGGVRLQEANAGEIAISELIKSIFALRLAGIPVVAVVAGKNGAFGGVGITATCADHLFISELGRSGVSGPEVIETVMGVDEYDSKDRALVWRTCGGKHRALLGLSNYCISDIVALKTQIINALQNPVTLDLEHLVHQQAKLNKLVANYATYKDGTEIWQSLGVTNPEAVPAMSDGEFEQLLANLKR